MFKTFSGGQVEVVFQQIVLGQRTIHVEKNEVETIPPAHTHKIKNESNIHIIVKTIHISEYIFQVHHEENENIISNWENVCK